MTKLACSRSCTERMPGGRVVGGRDVPDAERERPGDEHRHRPEEPDANARNQAVWPAALRSAVGTTKKSSGPRSATRISAGATSAISTCWSMCAESR